jgi:hypothetical protein
MPKELQQSLPWDKNLNNLTINNVFISLWLYSIYRGLKKIRNN